MGQPIFPKLETRQLKAPDIKKEDLHLILLLRKFIYFYYLDFGFFDWVIFRTNTG